MDFLIKAAMDERNQIENTTQQEPVSSTINEIREAMDGRKPKQQRIVQVNFDDIKDRSDEQAKFEAMRALFIPHQVTITWVPVAIRPQSIPQPSSSVVEPPATSNVEEQKEKPRIYRIPKGKHERAMMLVDLPKSITAFAVRLHAMYLPFTGFVPTLLSMTDKPEQWAAINNRPKVTLIASSIRVNPDDPRTCTVKVDFNGVYDRLIHFFINYDIVREKYNFNQKTLFRWWSSIDAPLLSPILNTKNNLSNSIIRVFTFPTDLIFHPHMVALQERPDEWFATMAEYLHLLITTLVPNPDYRALIERGSLGKCRTRVAPDMTTGELERMIIDTTNTFIATLNN